MKVQTVHGHHLEWTQAESADSPEEQTAYASGYELSIKPGEEKKSWDWSVKMTAEISETPELVDTGVAKSEAGAKTGAREATNRANRERVKAQQPEAKAEKAEAKMTVRQQEPEPKVDLVEKTKAQVAKNLAAAKNPRKTAGEMLDDVEQSLAA